METVNTGTCDLAVVGGGFTGASLALHLAREKADLSIAFFEPRGRLGYGLAYDTADPLHRINVPAEKMTVFGDAPDDFLQWCLHEAGVDEFDPDARGADGHLYPARGDFGRYVEERLAAYPPRVETVPSAARVVERVSGGFRVEAANGQSLTARRLVLCNSHGSPQFPWATDNDVVGHPRRLDDPWKPEALGRIGTRDEVLIFGTGLTMADTVVGLLDRGHVGPIRAVSRRGLLPRPHGCSYEPVPVDPCPGGETPGPAKFLRIIRSMLRDAESRGMEWQPVIEGVRAALPTIWPQWSMRERRSVLRHLRPYWDTHRYRLSPQVLQVLADARSSGQLTVTAGSIVGVRLDASEDRFRVGVRPRGSEEARTVSADSLVNCIGPVSDIRRSRDPLFSGLLQKGMIAADSLGLGVQVDQQCRVLDSDHEVVPGLYAAGPLTRSVFGEVMGVPEIAAQTAALSRVIKRDPLPEAQTSPDEERAML